MANEHARNRIDAGLSATFALSATTGTATQSAGIDLGADTVKPENVEVELLIPAIATGLAVEGSVTELGYELSNSSTFSSTSYQTVVQITAATGGVGAQTLRFRLPSDAARYIRATANINTNATTGGTTAAGLTATFQLRF